MTGQAKLWLPPTVRVLFGLMWAVDAAFKWAPTFRDHLLTYFSTGGQPGWAAHYISWWTGVLGHRPQLFGFGLALAESALALALLLGWGMRAACLGGAVLSLLIWSTAEGFGGPYGPGSTDVGTSIAYVLVFALLWWSDAGNRWSLPAWRRARVGVALSRRAMAGVAAVTAVTGLLVVVAVTVSSGPAPSGAMSHSMDGGQMQMTPGGQDEH